MQPVYNSHYGMAVKWLFQGGDRYVEVKYIVKLHFGDIKNWL